jgi:hypothetical protein
MPFLHTPSFVALNYWDDLIFFELTFISGRPEETRLGLLKALNDGLVSVAGILQTTSLNETFLAGISWNRMGRGLGQRARIPDTESQAEYAHHP